MTVAAMAVAIAATAAVVTAAKARRPVCGGPPAPLALLARARCCSPRHRRCRHCLARRRRVRHRRGPPRAALPGGGRPERPGDAKRLLGSSQDEHAAAVHCYGTHSGSVASPRMRRAPPLRFAVEVGIQAVLPTRCDAASSTCWCCWCWVSRLAPTTKFLGGSTLESLRAVQKGGGDSGK